MQIEVFTIPALGGEEKVKELNHFLVSHRVTDVQKTIVNSGGISFWSFCVSYLPMIVDNTNVFQDQKKAKTDYKNLLSETAFNRFSEYRKLRKEIAESEAIPPFAVFTDAELAKIAELEKPTIKELKKIQGIGDRKIEKYGTLFCIKEDETSGVSDGENS